jgi:hypothetical protein
MPPTCARLVALTTPRAIASTPSGFGLWQLCGLNSPLLSCSFARRVAQRGRLRDLSPARGVMFIAPNALYDFTPAPSGAECESERCAPFAPNGAGIDLGPAGAMNISLLRSETLGAPTKRNTPRSYGSQTSDRARSYLMQKPNHARVAGYLDNPGLSSCLPRPLFSWTGRAVDRQDEKSALP